jgi:chitodextrinase
MARHSGIKKGIVLFALMAILFAKPVFAATQASWPPNNVVTVIGLGTTSLTLNWSSATNAAGYKILKNNVLLATVGKVNTYQVTGLTKNTKYTFKVEARDSAGVYTTTGPSTTVTTLAADVLAPIWAPGSAVWASTVNPTSIVLNWAGASDNSGAVSYVIYMNGLYCGGSASTTFTATNLVPASPYSFKVEAVDSSGNASVNGPSATITTAASDTILSWPLNTLMVATNIKWNSMDVTWTKASGPVDHYTVYTLQGTQYLPDIVVPSTITTTHIGGLSGGVGYTVYVMAFDATGRAADTNLGQGPRVSITTPIDYSSYSGHYCYACHGPNPAVSGGADIFSKLTAINTGAFNQTYGDEKYRHSLSTTEWANGGGTQLRCRNCHNGMLSDPTDAAPVSKVTDPLNPGQPFTKKMTDPATGQQVLDSITFCLSCHSSAATAPSDVKGARANMDLVYASNTHGYGVTPANHNPLSTLNAPYYFGMAAMPCTTCHDPHGSSNWMHLKEDINGRHVVFSTFNSSAWCAACHNYPGHYVERCVTCHTHQSSLF